MRVSLDAGSGLAGGGHHPGRVDLFRFRLEDITQHARGALFVANLERDPCLRALKRGGVELVTATLG